MSEDESRNTEAGLTARPQPPPSRRRDKLQLSCNLCRRRKLKCDRIRPSCGNCAKAKTESQCVYAEAKILSSGRQVQNPATPVNVHNRLRRLEHPDVNIMESRGSRERIFLSTPSSTSIDSSPGSDRLSPTSKEPKSDNTAATPDCSNWSSILCELQSDSSSSSPGCNLNYRAPVRCEQRPRGPLLLYGCTPATSMEELLESVPPRKITNRMVSSYFNALDLSSAMIHSTEFLNEYESFWNDPKAVSPFWLALLYAMLCTSIQFQLANPENSMLTADVLVPSFNKYKAQVVRCLMFGGYTNGGPYAIQALLHYVVIEFFDMKEADTGVWVLLGMAVNIATQLKYHCDPEHLPNISPYEAEMRRRHWRLLFVLDNAISESVGMRRLVRNIERVAEPRNLRDSDFDANTTVLPPARLDTEPTPMLYCLAKGRALSVFGQVTDLITATRSSYAETMKVDSTLVKAHADIPACYRWRSLSHSITDSAQVLCRRMYLEIVYLKARVVLHLKHVAQSQERDQYDYSRKTTFKAISQLLEFHHICDEETQPSGQLFSARWRYLIAVHQNFLLASIAACFFLEHNKSDLGHEDLEAFKKLCRKTQDIWIRASRSSSEAAKAAEALRIALNKLDGSDEGLMSEQEPAPDANVAASSWESLYLPEYFGGFDLTTPCINLFDGLAMPPTFAPPDTLLVPPITGQTSDCLVADSWAANA